MPDVLFVTNGYRHFYQPINTLTLEWSTLLGSLCLLPRVRCCDYAAWILVCFSAPLLFNVLGGCGLWGLLACVLAILMLLVIEYFYTFLMLTTNTT